MKISIITQLQESSKMTKDQLRIKMEMIMIVEMTTKVISNKNSDQINNKSHLNTNT